MATVTLSQEVSKRAGWSVFMGILTAAVGAVTNAGQVPKGSKVAVIGAGGVGLNAVQGAVLAGCDRVIAIDSDRMMAAVARARASESASASLVRASGKRSVVACDASSSVPSPPTDTTWPGCRRTPRSPWSRGRRAAP